MSQVQELINERLDRAEQAREAERERIRRKEMAESLTGGA
jgi:hypothetical protein